MHSLRDGSLKEMNRLAILLSYVVVAAAAFGCKTGDDCDSGVCVVGYVWNECSMMAATVEGGDACKVDSECKSGKCVEGHFKNACKKDLASLKHGAWCYSDDTCESGHCLEGYTHNTCSALEKSLAAGMECHTDKECVTGKCSAHKTGSFCVKENAFLTGGQTCHSGYECASGTCSVSYVYGNKCQNQPGEKAVSSACRATQDCAKSAKDGFVVACKFAWPWHREGTCESIPMQPATYNYPANVPGEKNNNNPANGAETGVQNCHVDAECLSNLCIWNTWIPSLLGGGGFCSKVFNSTLPGCACNLDEECWSGGVCLPGSVINTCSKAKGSIRPGQACSVNSECSTNRCYSDDTCKSGDCLEGYTHNTCSALEKSLAAGKECHTDKGCITGKCSAHKTGSFCAKEKASLTGGQPCHSGNECASGTCSASYVYGNKCQNQPGEKAVSSACRATQDCAKSAKDGFAVACKFAWPWHREGTCEFIPLQPATDNNSGTCAETGVHNCHDDAECLSNLCIRNTWVPSLLRGEGFCSKAFNSTLPGCACNLDEECWSGGVCIPGSVIYDCDAKLGRCLSLLVRRGVCSAVHSLHNAHHQHASQVVLSAPPTSSHLDGPSATALAIIVLIALIVTMITALLANAVASLRAEHQQEVLGLGCQDVPPDRLDVWYADATTEQEALTTSFTEQEALDLVNYAHL